MKETALQYTTFGHAQLHHTDVIKVVLVPHALTATAEVLDCEIEQREMDIEDGAGEDILIEAAALKSAQYKLMRGHMFGHAPTFTRAELVVMDDALIQWIDNKADELIGQFAHDHYIGKDYKDYVVGSTNMHYACIALNKITKALQHMG